MNYIWKITFTLCQIFLTINFSFAQHQTDNWYFGLHNHIYFVHNIPLADTLSIPLNCGEGTTVMSSSRDGSTLFYTNGEQICNRNNTIMPHGHHLLGSTTTTQSALAIPYPNDTNKYYLFTMGPNAGQFPQYGGLAYYSIDMAADSGLGDITFIDSLVHPCAEKIAAVYHSNHHDIWVLVHRYYSDQFFAYLITDNGVNGPVITEVGTPYNGPNTSGTFAGYMNFSPDGSMIAAACYNTANFVEVYHFDKNTGVVSDPITDYFDSEHGPYGVCFSPNSSKLYVSTFKEIFVHGSLFQYDFSNGYNQTVMDNRTLIDTIAYDGLHAMQLGPDGKIYVIGGYLDRINNPNLSGSACYFQENAVPLSYLASYGLPSFLISYFDTSFNSVPVVDGVKRINVPTFITKQNSVFKINDLPSHTAIVLFDELGRVIYQSKNYLNDFDFNVLPSSTYFYSIKFADGSFQNGKVVWIR